MIEDNNHEVGSVCSCQASPLLLGLFLLQQFENTKCINNKCFFASDRYFLPSLDICSIISTPVPCVPWSIAPQSCTHQFCPTVLPFQSLWQAAGWANAAKPAPTSSFSPETSPLTPKSTRGRGPTGTTRTPLAPSSPSSWGPRDTMLRQTPPLRFWAPPTSSSRWPQWRSQLRRSPQRSYWTQPGQESAVKWEAGRLGLNRTWPPRAGAICWASSCHIRNTSSSRLSWTTGSIRCCSLERGQPTGPALTDHTGGPPPFSLPWCFAAWQKCKLSTALELTASRCN